MASLSRLRPPAISVLLLLSLQHAVAINRVFLCHVDDELLGEDISWLAVLEHGSRVRACSWELHSNVECQVCAHRREAAKSGLAPGAGAQLRL